MTHERIKFRLDSSRMQEQRTRDVNNKIKNGLQEVFSFLNLSSCSYQTNTSLLSNTSLPLSESFIMGML